MYYFQIRNQPILHLAWKDPALAPALNLRVGHVIPCSEAFFDIAIASRQRSSPVWSGPGTLVVISTCFFECRSHAGAEQTSTSIIIGRISTHISNGNYCRSAAQELPVKLVGFMSIWRMPPNHWQRSSRRGLRMGSARRRCIFSPSASFPASSEET